MAFSPPTRGMSVLGTPIDGVVSVFPAHAGDELSHSADANNETGFPRPRGG